MSAEKPEPGDVWVWQGEAFVIGQGGHRTYRERDIDSGYLPPAIEFTGVNVFDLLSGDPAAWAAALRFAPPELVTAAFVAQCEKDGRAGIARHAIAQGREALKEPGEFATWDAGEGKGWQSCIEALGLSALLTQANRCLACNDTCTLGPDNPVGPWGEDGEEPCPACQPNAERSKWPMIMRKTETDNEGGA